jgi:hypothetical protein
MATWHARTAQQMNDLVGVHGFSDAQINQLRVEAGSWADMIGNERSKLINVGNYQVRVTAENHEVTRVEIAT